ncbi:MAG: tRNA pseudouridine(55) synthase TruB [Clostridiales bacterium]|uniref:tRNA pseudouridine(55) synthase TruB n=1 Tax=Clostridium sp. N3C TaxID=1776758 RepID=UPI00092E0AD7|nr:tRNA pseudouridine(55) synthase TruB [Clostridium sp. N3C]NLZ48206.1 tRNA pseudouridine(55) synthase TruB [Clostridiales bacterium]SCN21906.1 tRNA pseudouridine synthase B [Clostridium sp. N3C]
MDGIINCYKPTGITSFDAVNKIKRLVKGTKVGHTGTLDPAACGVLPICIGKATKLVNYIMEGTKGYRVEMTLGVVTDTYDQEGNIIRSTNVDLQESQVKNAILSFIGDSMQTPPMYSALKIKGKRLYELAREGKEVYREPRKITIHHIDFISMKNNIVKFDVECSKGTYIRSLCYDIGEKLGCGAMMSGLERRFSGSFSVENSVPLDKLNADNIHEYIIPMDKALSQYAELIVDVSFEKLLRNGVKVKNTKLIKDIKLGNYRVYNKDHQLIGIGKRSEEYFEISILLI